MKLVKLKILDSFLKETIGGEFVLYLYDEANILHLINKVDICRKGKFFIKNYPEYRSLLHMTWNPIQKRFYKTIAISAYTKNNEFFEARENPKLILPDGLTIFLGLGLCKSEGEEIVDFETFQKELQKSLH
ncbi:MAG: hypothetical protein PVF15_06520 [Candidatus Bathyarchaeota archaeon]|jgi:hypothetical protein